MNIFTLMGTVLVDNQKANESISKTGKESEGLMTKVGKGLKAVAGIGAGIAGAVGAGVTAMTGFVAKTLETTSTIEKFSNTCNVSTEEFQRLDGVMKTMGWSMESAAGDFAALSEKMHEAATTGEGEAFEMFQRLGVETTNLDGSLRNTGDVFNDMILSLQNVSNETERQAIASIMLGTTSEELAPLLKMTNEEFIAMKDNVNVIDEEQLNKASQFKASWEQVKQTFNTVVTEIGINLMPMFQTVLDWVNSYMPEIQAVIEVAFGIVNDVIGVVVEHINGLITWFTNLLANNQEISVDLKVLWDGVKTMFTTFFKDIQELLSAFSSFCIKIWDRYGEDIIAIIKPLWEQLKNIFQTGFDILKNSIDFFTAFFKGDFEGMKQAIISIIDAMWVWVKNSFNNSIDFIKGLVPTMLQAGKDLFNGLWDGIKSVWSGIASWVSDKVSWIADKLMFWRDAEDEMSRGSKKSSNSRSIDGSHKNGLDYVPYDGYVAELHKSEMVLTAEEADDYRKSKIVEDKPVGNTTNNIIFNINSPTGNPKEISRQIQNDLEVYNRALGVV